ncbi:DUF202 domain-containing protein [Subtercola boreus]|uniref:DUF202 domain-containing protein n=1 Tax=Subtercola boreus TaxID=120213 RepID=A0A3E0W7S7_9MICO|nr:DUF202 domain-containing protein [Subtercola boreus]RFA19063.1 hypothetical protein B7R24_13105 [Subtercola boreus]RFA19201.1 hypothetical protein B7R23_13085 [Subtercola boreus]RFA25663.1 hypothetical protein B7R25_13205 [Subtercola boreus]
MSGGDGNDVFDPGLQVERTALAWQRTALALIAGSLVGARVLAPTTGWGGIGLGVLGALLGLFVLARSGIRYRHTHGALTTNRRAPGPLPGALLMGVLAAAVLVAGVVALLYVALHAG